MRNNSGRATVQPFAQVRRHARSSVGGRAAVAAGAKTIEVIMWRAKHVAAALACALAATSWRCHGGISVAAAPSVTRNAGPEFEYNRNLVFLKHVARHDALWAPVLREKVNVYNVPSKHVDRYATREKPSPVDKDVDPFQKLVVLMKSNASVGTTVSYVAAAVHQALACTVLKRLSVQAVALHRLIVVEPEAIAVPNAVRWLEQMTRLAADKLAALGYRLPVVARAHHHVTTLLLPHADFNKNGLYQLAEDMYVEIEEKCASPDNGQGHYWTVVQELKRGQTMIDMNYLQDQLADDNYVGLEDLEVIKEISTNNGNLELTDNDIENDWLENMTPENLRKLANINWIQMYYLMLSLPIRALAEKQWSNIFTLSKLKTVVKT